MGHEEVIPAEIFGSSINFLYIIFTNLIKYFISWFTGPLAISSCCINLVLKEVDSVVQSMRNQEINSKGRDVRVGPDFIYFFPLVNIFPILVALTTFWNIITVETLINTKVIRTPDS